MDHQKEKRKRQLRRRRHVRRNITGTSERPRLSVFRSSKHIYAQLIDDLSGATLAAASSRSKGKDVPYGGNVKAAAGVVMGRAGRGVAVGAGPGVRAVAGAGGIRTTRTTTHGSTTPINLVKATIRGLLALRTREEVARLRGVTQAEKHTSEPRSRP